MSHHSEQKFCHTRENFIPSSLLPRLPTQATVPSLTPQQEPQVLKVSFQLKNFVYVIQTGPYTPQLCSDRALSGWEVVNRWDTQLLPWEQPNSTLISLCQRDQTLSHQENYS